MSKPERRPTRDWDAAAFRGMTRFRRPPFEALKAQIEWRPNMAILDLGCGAGDLTREIHEQAGAASTLGIDRSESMLALANAEQVAGLSFERHDLADYTPRRRYDLIMSNAAWQWVKNHPALIERCAEALNDGGQLAIDMVVRGNPYFKLAFDLFESEPFRPFKGKLAEVYGEVLSLDDYARLLDDHGFTRQRVRSQVHTYQLASWDELLHHLRTTAIYYKWVLPQELWARYREELEWRFWALVETKRTRTPFFATQRLTLWGARER